MKYCELSHVKQTATREGEKDLVILEEVNDGTFLLKRGEIGVQVGKNKIRSTLQPMTSWDITVASYLSRGYKMVPGRTEPPLRTVFRKQTQKREYRPEKDLFAQALVQMLLALAKKVVEENFSSNVLLDVPSQEQFSEGERLLKVLAEGYGFMDTREFNRILCEYFMVMPRRMKYLNDNLAKGKDRHGKKLSDQDAALERAKIASVEKDRFDILKSLVSGTPGEDLDIRQTATEANGISIRGVTKDEEAWIQKHLAENASKYLRAWRIENHRTEKDFDDYCTKEHLIDGKGIDHLFHGSRGENFWSIITNGLTVNPLNVVITGKAYGQGTYFAPDARKSLGYTDRLGSKWVNGGRETGLLGIYKVATGKRYDGSHGCDSSLTWSKLQKICPGAHCTWAESRYSGFIMDEVIVYQDCQSTIEYLVEISA